MNSKIRKMLSFAACLGLIFCSIAGAAAYDGGELNLQDLTQSGKIESLGNAEMISNDIISSNSYKSDANNNPISSEIFCADPTSVEYNGSLYVYGTNDHQQYEEKGPDKDNTYEKIKSLVIYSTDDMVNWVYHGEINVGEVAPWITNSWAPSITSRIEDDGLEHFYLYFSNNGLGVGVITATNPLGPWSDPLGEPLVSSSTPGLSNCPNPFDPGVVIDDNGDAWLSFGGGSNGTVYQPGVSKIVKLGDDMVSFASDFATIPAPYFFEASELNYINGTYVYTYNMGWVDHPSQWDYDCDSPSQCSMIYMTSKTPLDPDSWVMGGEYFKNPGTAGFDYSNNHTHLQKYKDKYYILYHTLSLKSSMGIKAGCRSLCVDEIDVDEENVSIEKIGGTKKGVKAVSAVDPYSSNLGMELANTADVSFDTANNAEPSVVSDAAGAWVSVRNVSFGGAEVSDPIEMPDPTVLTGVDTITYDITVTSVDKDTTITMYPSAKNASDSEGFTEISGTGNYKITCNLDGAGMLQNLGYFRASDDAQITFTLNKIILNEKYEMDVTSVLTNTTAWADGLKNIWNYGNSSSDEDVYSCDTAVLRYVKADDAIELFTVDESLIPTTEASEENGEGIKDALKFLATVKGSGRVEVRLDKKDGELLTAIDFDNLTDYMIVFTNEVAAVSGTHDLYFVFSEKDISFKLWQFTEEDLIADTTTEEPTTAEQTTQEETTAEPDTDVEVTTEVEETSEEENTTSALTEEQTVSTDGGSVASTTDSVSDTVSDTTAVLQTTAAVSGSDNQSGSTTAQDKPVNTGAVSAIGLSAFMAAGFIGAAAIKKRKK